MLIPLPYFETKVSIAGRHPHLEQECTKKGKNVTLDLEVHIYNPNDLHCFV
jgi:hypothetical protein